MNGEVCVLGGEGFLGRAIVQELLAHGFSVCIASRRAGNFTSATSGVQHLKLDITEEATFEDAFKTADAVVNCVGLYVETPQLSFQAVHVDGARRVAERARGAGVGKFIQISGIGVDPNSKSAYVKARADGEDAVRNAFPDATILRPSAMFDREGAFFGALEAMARALPVVPLFGDGATRLQPVYVGDVAQAVRRVLDTENVDSRVFELGGPDIYTFREILQRAATRCDRRRLFLQIPFWVWRSLARVASVLPKPPLTMAQVVLMENDNVVGDDVGTFADLSISPKSAADMGLV